MQMTRPIYNLYCDESGHAESDGNAVMVLGAMKCLASETAEISREVRALKKSFGLASAFEVKWTKVSPGQADFYLALVDLFLRDPRLAMRVTVVPDKSCLDHGRFDQSHDDWYYKMYFTMLKSIFRRDSQYRVYLDIKDTQGAPKTEKLHDVICNSRLDFDRECVIRVQQIRSHESELLQIADLIIGATGYRNRGLGTNAAKIAIVERIESQLGGNVFTETSYLSAEKINMLVWRPRGSSA